LLAQPDVQALDFRRAAPIPTAIRAERTRDGTTRIHVRFRPDPRLGDRLILRPDGVEIELKREVATTLSDGPEYTAALPVRFSFVRRAKARLLKALAKGHVTSLPVFQGRELTGTTPVSKLFADTASEINLPVHGVPQLVKSMSSLTVTDPLVVNDPTRTGTPCGGNGSGVWSFKHLMEEMANEPATGINASDLVMNWLLQWEGNQFINGFEISEPPHSPIRPILDAWPRLPDGRLDLAMAPFALRAIVNRIDLATNPSYGTAGGAEGRFVFGLVKRDDCTTPFPPLDIIIEYGVPHTNCTELRDWANQWLDLGELPIGSPEYDAALEALTEQFVRRGADPSKPNGSALDQVRTNDEFGNGWGMRQFRLLGAQSAMLVGSPVSQTPDESTFNLTANLATFINANTPSILAGTYVVPNPWLGAWATLTPDTLPNMYWRAAGIADNDARQAFSLGTCGACHSRETNTKVRHIAPPAHPGEEAKLSGFLTGITVHDPVSGEPRHFADLIRRAQVLWELATASCVQVPDKMAERRMILPLPPIEFEPTLESE
jgi:hypothetical protein